MIPFLPTSRFFQDHLCAQGHTLGGNQGETASSKNAFVSLLTLFLTETEDHR